MTDRFGVFETTSTVVEEFRTIDFPNWMKLSPQPNLA